MTEAEFLPLYDAHHNSVYRLALTMTRSVHDAEDIVQTVFVRLLTHPPAAGAERPWLTRVTINACKDLMRSAWRRKTAPLEDDISFSAPAERVLFDAVLALPEKYRAAVHLHYYEGYTCREIGRLLNITPSAVSMRLHRARELLKNKLEDAYE